MKTGAFLFPLLVAPSGQAGSTNRRRKRPNICPSSLPDDDSPKIAAGRRFGHRICNNLLLHSVPMKRFQRVILLPLLLLIASTMASVGHAYAEEPARLEVAFDQQLVYCEAAWPGTDDSLRQALQSGIAVTFIWHVRISEVRKYWLNRTIADIRVSRRVTPDLLSRKWLLEDEASGISRQESSAGGHSVSDPS